MTEANVVTTYKFNENEYLVKMVSCSRFLEIVVTDKLSGEEWECSYDKTYIENLTQKTGNFKKFHVFLSMMKSGLLKTSDSVSLELLTYEDLESLRLKRVCGRQKSAQNCINDKRYLIITYNVEFDRIHYPLPLEYAGPPDPKLLQITIVKLRKDLAKANEKFKFKQNGNISSKITEKLKRKIEELQMENIDLQKEIRVLKNNKSKHPNVDTLQRAIMNLEKSVIVERNSHHQLVEKLRFDKMNLLSELNEVKKSERTLKNRLSRASIQSISRDKCKACEKRTKSLKSNDDDIKTLYRRNTSPTPRNVNSVQPRRSLSSPVRKPENRHLKQNNKTRSSSNSSSRSQLGIPEINSTTPKSSRRSSANHSRSSSVTSTRSIPSRSSRNSPNEQMFGNLEGKIKNLLNMLQANQNG